MSYLVFSSVLCFFSFSIFFLQRWAVNRFPMDDALAVFYTLQNAPSNFDPSIIIESLTIVFVSLIVCVAIFFVLLFFRTKLVNKNFILLSSFTLFLISIFISGKNLHLLDYVSILKTNQNNVPYFNEDDYKKIEDKNIIFPEKKRNLIVLFLESMESSFFEYENGGFQEKDLIPELLELSKQNINFSDTEITGGGFDLPRTNWTCAAILSKFFAIPFICPPLDEKNEYSAKHFLSLTDILFKNGYTNRFIFGSDKKFASRDTLLEEHGNVEIHDINWYKKNNLLPNDYQVFWGFEDEKLFEFARKELDELSEKNSPFMFGLLTVDTHMPYGYECKSCVNEYNNQLKNAIRCNSKKTFDFINWCESQKWYDNTSIVIFGDHLFMDTKKTKLFLDREKINQKRRWLNIFINLPFTCDTDIYKNRVFSSFDMCPTILASLGAKIKDERLALGVNLFSREKTLLEKYGVDEVSKKLKTF